MQRLLALPFALLLGVVSFGLIAAGAAILEQEAEDPGPSESAGLLDVDAFSEDNDEADESGAIAGASLLGFGILGFIAALALLIASLSGDRSRPTNGVQQQQQQQVVVVRPDGGVETEQGRQR